MVWFVGLSLFLIEDQHEISHGFEYSSIWAPVNYEMSGIYKWEAGCGCVATRTTWFPQQFPINDTHYHPQITIQEDGTTIWPNLPSLSGSISGNSFFLYL